MFVSNALPQNGFQFGFPDGGAVTHERMARTLLTRHIPSSIFNILGGSLMPFFTAHSNGSFLSLAAPGSKKCTLETPDSFNFALVSRSFTFPFATRSSTVATGGSIAYAKSGMNKKRKKYLLIHIGCSYCVIFSPLIMSSVD